MPNYDKYGFSSSPAMISAAKAYAAEGPISPWANKKKYNEKYEDEKYTPPSRRTRTRNILAEADQVLGTGARKPKGGASIRTISKAVPKRDYLE